MSIKQENGSVTFDGQDLKDLQDKARQYLDDVRPPEGTPAISETETQYAVICPAHGKVFLTNDEYGRQMCRPDSLWKCPHCGRHAQFDDDQFEKFLENESEHGPWCEPDCAGCKEPTPA